MFPGPTITLHKTIQLMQIQIKLKVNEMWLMMKSLIISIRWIICNKVWPGSVEHTQNKQE
jgi:hypothetical protein